MPLQSGTKHLEADGFNFKTKKIPALISNLNAVQYIATFPSPLEGISHVLLRLSNGHTFMSGGSGLKNFAAQYAASLSSQDSSYTIDLVHPSHSEAFDLLRKLHAKIYENYQQTISVDPQATQLNIPVPT